MPMSNQIDKEFPRTWPFGTLKTIHWLSPLATLITIYLAPSSTSYGSMGFVLFTGWNLFLYAFITWCCYILELQRKNLQIGQSYVFVPFLFLDFVVAVVATVFSSLSTLLCLIAMVHSLKYRITVVLAYLIATLFCMASGAAFGYFAILIYRACPNGNLRNLLTMFLDGHSLHEIGGGVPSPAAGQQYATGGGRPPV